MAYKFKFAHPLGGVPEVTFPRLTWAHIKMLKEADDLQGFVERFVGLAKPHISPEDLGSATGADYEQLNDLYVHMSQRLGEWSGGQFKLSHPIKLENDTGGIEITALSFDPATLGELYEYYALNNEQDKVEMFIRKFGRCIGDHKSAKSVVLSQGIVETLSAKDVIFIRDKIAGKSQGGSASWSVVAE